MKKSKKEKNKNTTGYLLGVDDCVEHTSDLLNAGGVDAPSDVGHPIPKGFFYNLEN